MEYIAFDAHKRYTQVSVETVDGARRDRGPDCPHPRRPAAVPDYLRARLAGGARDRRQLGLGLWTTSRRPGRFRSWSTGARRSSCWGW